MDCLSMIGSKRKALKVTGVVKSGRGASEILGYYVEALDECPFQMLGDSLADIRTLTLNRGESRLLNSFDMALTLALDVYNSSCVSETGTEVHLFVYPSEEFNASAVPLCKVGYSADDEDEYKGISDLPESILSDLGKDEEEYIKSSHFYQEHGVVLG